MYYDTINFHTGTIESGSFDEGTGTIWLSNVYCNGTERTLTNCAATINATELCTHAQDVAIQCTAGKNIKYGYMYSDCY